MSDTRFSRVLINNLLKENIMFKASPLTIVAGRLSTANWLASPNCNTRPADTTIDTIVIHNISLPPNEFGARGADGIHYVKALFTNQLDWNAHPYFQTIQGAEVSAHLFIERDGAITQFVSFDERAWHAGKSSYLGRPECNNYSIGIELEGSDFVSFTDEQYETLAQVINAIYDAYPKTQRHLTGHSDIAPSRKTDPGDYFEWTKLRELVAKKLDQ
jgi:AmpD protein